MLICGGDPDVNWFVDYNYENIDEATGLPTGTLRIPAFLMHNYRYVDSRSILKRSCDYVRTELLSLIKIKAFLVCHTSMLMKL